MAQVKQNLEGWDEDAYGLGDRRLPVRARGDALRRGAARSCRSWRRPAPSRRSPTRSMLLEHEPVITLGSRAVRAEELPLAGRGVREPRHRVVEVAAAAALDLPRPRPARLLPDPRPDSARARPAPLRARRSRRRSSPRWPTSGSRAGRSTEPHASGVWVDDRKIASIGVRCARWVTSHGLALNVDLDLGVYDLFDACGLGGRPVHVDRARDRPTR